MQLYFSPLSCSIASRIALYEAGAEATFVEVDRRTKRLPDGNDYRDVHSLGMVPALRTEDGTLLTENFAVLQYISELPGAGPLDPGPEARTALRQWLSFIASELHKGVFAMLFDPTASDEVRRYAMHKSAIRLAHMERHMAGRAFVLERFSVADAYLYAVLNWTLASPIELNDYPALEAFHSRTMERPSVARAFAEELPLYRAARAQAAE